MQHVFEIYFVVLAQNCKIHSILVFKTNHWSDFVQGYLKILLRYVTILPGKSDVALIMKQNALLLENLIFLKG
jgi:hypothetical protein